MNALPTEIFHELFGYLSVHDLCTVRFLNKYLNNVVEGYLRPKLMWESRTQTEISEYEYDIIPTEIGSIWESQTKTDINQLIDIIRTRTESGFTFPTIFTSFHFHLRYVTLDQCEEFINIYGEYVEKYYFSTLNESSVIEDIPANIKLKENRKADVKGDQDKIQVLLSNSRNTVRLSETNQNNDEVCPNCTPQQEGIFLEIDTSVHVQVFQSMLTTNRAIKSVKVISRCERGLTEIQEMLISVPEVFKLSTTAIKILNYRYGSVLDKVILDLAASKRIEIESLTMYNYANYGVEHFNDFVYHFSKKLSKLFILLTGQLTIWDVTIPYLPNLTCLKIFVLRNVFIKQFVQGQFPKLKELLLHVPRISEQIEVLHNLNLEYLKLNYHSSNLTTTVQSDFDKLYAFLESQSQTLKVLELYIDQPFQCPRMKALECCYIDSPLLNSFDFPFVRLVKLSPLVTKLLNKDKVLPNVTGLVLKESKSYFPETDNNDCKILLHTIIKVFPNLTKLEFYMEPQLQHLELIFTRMLTLKELSLRFFDNDVYGDKLWQALTGFDRSKESDGKENIYGPSLADMQALEFLRIIGPSLEFFNALEYLAITNRMKKLNCLCLHDVFTFTNTATLQQIQKIIPTLKVYHQQVVIKDDYYKRCWYDEKLKRDSCSYPKCLWRRF